MIHLDLETRVKAMCELLEHPTRWASQEYVFGMSGHLMKLCKGRADLQLALYRAEAKGLEKSQ